MKLHLPSVFRRLLLSAMAAAVTCSVSYADTTYLTEGIDLDNIMNSTRFYDSGKGYFLDWVKYGKNYLGEFQEYYRNQGSLEILGDLYERTNKNGTTLAAKMQPLTDDSNTCWAQSAMNLVEYWHSYYGVFCKDERVLPYGYTYDKQYLKMLGGSLSLKQSLIFQDVFSNDGDTLDSYLDWFMCGDDRPYFSTIEKKDRAVIGRSIF